MKAKELTSPVLALVMCLTLCVPVWAAERSAHFMHTEERDNYTVVFSSEPPPGFEPAESSPIMPYGEEDDCGHYCPPGYFYVGGYSGNTSFDAFISGTVITLSSALWAPITAMGVSTILCSVAIGGITVLPSPVHSITGDYHVASYECSNPGIYPYIYWHHVWCHADYDGDGIAEYFCTAQYEYALLP